MSKKSIALKSIMVVGAVSLIVMMSTHVQIKATTDKVEAGTNTVEVGSNSPYTVEGVSIIRNPDSADIKMYRVKDGPYWFLVVDKYGYDVSVTQYGK